MTFLLSLATDDLIILIIPILRRRYYRHINMLSRDKNEETRHFGYY